MKVAVIGAGWAGCAAAVEAIRRGHQVTLFEASRTAGGRARRVEVMHCGERLLLDNGQHILIGAYPETLRLMSDLGIDVETALLRLPLTLRFPDGDGLTFARLPVPLNALAAIVRARGWSWRDRLSLIRLSTGWQMAKFQCAAELSVAQLCRGTTLRIMQQLIEPLCVSALNTPAARASGRVFLRVMHDALFSDRGGSDLLLPRSDLSALLPEPASQWLQRMGGSIRLGARVQSLQVFDQRWGLQTESTDAATQQEYFDSVVLACAPADAARLVQGCGLPCNEWLERARALQFEAIATIYLSAPGARLGHPMLSLRSGERAPAQFVFDRGQLGGPPGLLAFVVSASADDRATLEQQVALQAREQLGLDRVEPLQTIVEKRATFACTPGLVRPDQEVVTGLARMQAPRLLACGDYVAGSYPATLEGAVRSGLQAARRLA